MELYNKYRPKDFATLLGNDEIVEILEMQYKNTREMRNHSYFIEGPTGTGKTTIARIMADIFECELVEMNSSEDNGVDFARKFVQDIQYRGFGKDKMYVLDECHRLTTDAQNILLKVLEEPPNHAYIVLCSTDPQKVMKTVINRTLRLKTSKPSNQELFELLEDICDIEKFDVSTEVLEAIVKQSETTPREAISMLSSISAVPTFQQLEYIHGTQGGEHEVIELSRALLQTPKWATVAKILSGIEANPDSVRMAVLGYMSKVLLSGQRNAQAFTVLFEFENLGFGCTKHSLIKASFRCCKE